MFGGNAAAGAGILAAAARYGDPVSQSWRGSAPEHEPFAERDLEFPHTVKRER